MKVNIETKLGNETVSTREFSVYMEETIDITMGDYHVTIDFIGDSKQNEIERLKSALKLARKHVGNEQVDLDGNGNNFVSVKSVIDEVLEGE